jgi:hypothetical protein
MTLLGAAIAESETPGIVTGANAGAASKAAAIKAQSNDLIK